MKVIRYIMIAFLVGYFALSLKSIIAPEITFTSAGGAEQGISEVDSWLHAHAVEQYRTKSLLWLALNGLILCGWIFNSHRNIVLGVVAGSTALLAYIIFEGIRGVGYTMTQSVLGAMDGHGMPIFGWNWFYLLALIALPIVAWKKAEQTGDVAGEIPAN